MNQTILTYDDVKNIPLGSSPEPLVVASKYDGNIVCEYKKLDMFPWTGFDILVRDSVAKKLARANFLLNKSGYRLKVVYGYRSPSVQSKYFNARFAEISAQNPKMSTEQLVRLTHNYVAVPDSAGHTLGAAVDVTILDRKGKACDMGAEIADYSDPVAIQTYANVGVRPRKLRQILLEAMTSVGFAPFLGEWWHFSYGDKEWASYYDKKCAVYGLIETPLRSKVLTIAGGNKTMLQVVEGWRGDSMNRRVCEMLMGLTSNVDQAGVYYKDTNRLMMAGGEFCGNAAAAVATLLHKGEAPLEYSVSGFDGKVEATVAPGGVVKARFKGMEYRVDNTKNLCVDFGGIVHVLVEGTLPDDYEVEANKIRSQAGLDDRQAVGVVWCRRIDNSRVEIDPVVWVRDIDTLFYETSCGSGAMAAAIGLDAKNVQQPTGEEIVVTVKPGCLETVSTVGRIGVVSRKDLCINHELNQVIVCC